MYIYTCVCTCSCLSVGYDAVKGDSPPPDPIPISEFGLQYLGVLRVVRTKAVTTQRAGLTTVRRTQAWKIRGGGGGFILTIKSGIPRA